MLFCFRVQQAAKHTERNNNAKYFTLTYQPHTNILKHTQVYPNIPQKLSKLTKTTQAQNTTAYPNISYNKIVFYKKNIARIAKRCPLNISSVVNVLKLFLLKISLLIPSSFVTIKVFEVFFFTILVYEYCHNFSFRVL